MASGRGNQPSDAVHRIVKEARKLHADYLRQLRALQRSVGISEAEIRALMRARDTQFLPSLDDERRLWRVEVEDVPKAEVEDLDHLAEAGLARLLRRVDPKWLRVESQKPYRLQSDFLTNPLHVVNGIRVGMSPTAQGPQRFARMLLVTQDHLAKEWELDFFSAAMFVPEIARLGTSLDEVKELGAEAERKLAALPSMNDAMVSSTVYELLVGAAFVRKGVKLTMVAENRSRKVPDYQISSLGPIPGAIECKRRLGLTAYELAEAEVVQGLYASLRPRLHERGVHGSIAATFNVPVRLVSAAEFTDHVLAALDREEPSLAPWGAVEFRSLPYLRSIEGTRLYSPDYLQEAFQWDTLQDEWDGLLCEVESPPHIAVELFRNPLCLKWRSDSEEALRKKTRGITSLWADAVKQIPDGEIGFIYIAYPEGARPTLADTRTREIISSGASVWHRWSVRAPVMLVSRLYPRPVGPGTPDLIESVLVGVSEGEESWMKELPIRIYT